MRKEGRNTQDSNPHCPRDDSPGKEERWLTPSPLDYYTSATDVKPAFKTEPMDGKQKTYLGEI